VEQQSLFGSDVESSVTIPEAAKSLLVSEASIRNWIKTGYLETAGRNRITRHSFSLFKSQTAGRDKLTQRANKSLKDHHVGQLANFSFAEADDGRTDCRSLSDRYEASLSESYRNKEGIFYTPMEVAESFFEHLPVDCSKLTFCDPCCGSGNFLIAALRRGFRPENIYGIDTDAIALEIARRRFNDLGVSDGIHLIHGDFIDGAILGRFRACDVIFTNPPWGKKLQKRDKDDLAKALGAGNCTDTSALFLLACLRLMTSSGYLGMLLQEAFFNIATFESVRVKALERRIVALTDYGRPFKGLLTKARGIVIKNESPDESGMILCRTDQGNRFASQYGFRRNPRSILNFTISERDAEVVDHLFARSHVTLKGNARFGLGLVTGNNAAFVSHEQREGLIPVYRGADITRTGIKVPSAFIPDDLALYQQVAPLEMYQSREKLIYKFISSDLAFYHDREGRFMLNSANMLVLSDEFPIDHAKLCFLLNTRLMSWLFSRLFETHKVLKSDLETLPIYVDYFAERSHFSEKALLDFLSLEEVSGGTYRIKR
jgi:site-specific DNA-methyltransferase (adenine-specific)